VASLIDWRAAFVLLAIPGFFLARTLWRTVPEPLRGGQSRLEPGMVDVGEAFASAGAEPAREREEAEEPPSAPGEPRSAGEEPPSAAEETPPAAEEPPSAAEEPAHDEVRRRGVAPDPRLVLDDDPQAMGLGRAVRYILSVPTNMLLIIGSSLGYFFFAGLQTFALLFVRGHYHVGQATAELVLAMLVVGAMVGTLVSGRLTDYMLRRGFVEARVTVPAICYLAAAALLIPGILGNNLTPALWFDVAGAALLSAANPGLDAARLDIMPAGLWGRAESTRTFLRSLTQAVAPLAFGGLADLIAGIFPAQAPIGTHPGGISASTARGLEISFLIMLSSLAAAGVFLARAHRTYPRDVATAAASNQGGGLNRGTRE
jgi:hypothetical protein